MTVLIVHHIINRIFDVLIIVLFHDLEVKMTGLNLDFSQALGAVVGFG